MDNGHTSNRAQVFDLLLTVEKLYLQAHGWTLHEDDEWSPPENYKSKNSGRRKHKHAVNSQKLQSYEEAPGLEAEVLSKIKLSTVGEGILIPGEHKCSYHDTYGQCTHDAMFYVPVSIKNTVVLVADKTFPGGSPFFLCKVHWLSAQHELYVLEEFFLDKAERLLSVKRVHEK